jgi:hypothetical protein
VDRVGGSSSGVELTWPGKSTAVDRSVLPLRPVERVGGRAAGWTNRLVHADNLQVLAALLASPEREHVCAAGGLKLVYVDPPFDVGSDFSVGVAVGDGDAAIQTLAYRDTWGAGPQSYLSMIFPRLRLIHELLADDGAILVHVDWRLDAPMRLLLDEVFGSANFRNAIIWQYGGKGLVNVRQNLVRSYGVILLYAKSPAFTPNLRSGELSASVRKRFGKYLDDDHRIRFGALRASGDLHELDKAEAAFRSREGREPTDEDVARDYSGGALLRDVWSDIAILRESPAYAEYLGYPTQKPEALLRRLLLMASQPGDLVADFFCGSGTTLAVAEELGRPWIGADSGGLAIRTSRRRLLAVAAKLQAEGRPVRPFELSRVSEPSVTVPTVPGGPAYAAAEIDYVGARSVRVRLTGYGVVTPLPAPAAVVEALRAGWSKVVVDQGEVVRLAKDRKGVLTRTVLTQSWADWVDAWAVDFDAGDGAPFVSGWEAFRSREGGSLELTSAEYAYPAAGTYALVVRVTDVLGTEVVTQLIVQTT